jgi:hypothetical protein
MNEELRAYLGLEAKVAAAFNFFINGMLSALIYHKADLVPADTLSLAIDIVLTSLLMFILTAFFGMASLKRTKTLGILEPGSQMIQRLSRLFRHPVLFGTLMGMASAAVLFAVIAPSFGLLGIKTLPFDIYIFLKTIGCALLGSVVTLLSLNVGLRRVR